jgi:hypothetical protein
MNIQELERLTKENDGILLVHPYGLSTQLQIYQKKLKTRLIKILGQHKEFLIN